MSSDQSSSSSSSFLLSALNQSSASNSSSPPSSSLLIDPGPIYKSYTIGSFLIGFLITIIASILNAFGINLQKLDLNRIIRSSTAASEPRRADCLRPVWFIGLCLYILSQVLGSTLALQYMRSEYVAPLGSASLIFNFLFARWLLGTRITTLDALGTLVIIIGVIGVIGFSNIRQFTGIDQEANMSLATLKELWARPAWIFYLIGLELTTILIVWLAGIAFEILMEKNDLGGPRDAQQVRRDGDLEDYDQVVDDVVETALRNGGGRKNRSKNHSNLFSSTWRALMKSYRSVKQSVKLRIEGWSVSRSEQTLMKLDGLLWGCGAGLLAGQTLIFAKSYVKLVTNGLSHDGRGSLSDLAHPLSILIMLFLVSTGILQVWCLNRGLKVYDSTLIVPVLFATYTASGFVNSLIYLHELPTYRNWVLLMIWLCITVLVVGVCMLSSKRSDSNLKVNEIGNYSSTSDPEGEVQATAIGGTMSEPRGRTSCSSSINGKSNGNVGSAGSSRFKSLNSENLKKLTVLSKDGKKNNSLLRKDRSGSVMSLRDLKDHLQDTIKMIPQTRIISELDDGKDEEENYDETILEEDEDEEKEGRLKGGIEFISKNPFEEYEIGDEENEDGDQLYSQRGSNDNNYYLGYSKPI